ncbi:MAG: FAD-dependent oxidoreductase [Nocardioidaceae bacterium]
MRVLVVGAGVTGLSCAVRLAESGHEVHVVARDLPLETTSAAAAALWYPYRAYPFERVTRWAQATYDEFTRLAESDPDAGVTTVPGTEVMRQPTADPWWRGAVPRLDRVSALPDGYRDGWSFAAPVIEMPVYLGWLGQRLEALGGTVTRMTLSALPDTAPVVVNASGLAARSLADDWSMTPVRGEVVYVGQFGLDRWWLSSEGPTYVVPRAHDVVVGGTDEEGSWNRNPDSSTAERILDRAAALVPELAQARVVGHRVGLRPARPEVRLEEQARRNGVRVIHCYGHGGAGVTLSWGCADEVVALVEAGAPV